MSLHLHNAIYKSRLYNGTTLLKRQNCKQSLLRRLLPGWQELLRSKADIQSESRDGTSSRGDGTSASNLDLIEGFKCAICLDIMFQPVALECGHRFCARCAIATVSLSRTSVILQEGVRFLVLPSSSAERTRPHDLIGHWIYALS